MDLGKGCAKLTVCSSDTRTVGCNITVIDGQTVNTGKTNASSLSIASKGGSLTLLNKGLAKLSLENGNSITLEDAADKNTLTMNSTGSKLCKEDVGSLAIESDLVLQHKSGRKLACSTSSAQLEYDSSNYLKISSTGITMKFTNGNISGNSAALKINSGAWSRWASRGPRLAGSFPFLDARGFHLAPMPVNLLNLADNRGRRAA